MIRVQDPAHKSHFLQLSKHIADFGLQAKPCDVHVTVSDRIRITNIGDVAAKYEIHSPLESKAYQIEFIPSSGVIKPGTFKDMEIKLRFETPAKLKDVAYVNVSGCFHAILFDLESKVASFDFEININEISFPDSVPIGRGVSAEVFRGVWKGTNVAVKKFYSNFVSLNPKNIANFMKEVQTLSTLRHPSKACVQGFRCWIDIVLFMGACATHNNVCIVMEYLELGSLYKLLHNPAYKNEFTRRVRMCKDAIQGMIYLLDKGFLHRDLKSLNLLVSKTLEVKVADFGLSKTMEMDSKTSNNQGPTGTYLWMSPVICDLLVSSGVGSGVKIGIFREIGCVQLWNHHVGNGDQKRSVRGNEGRRYRVSCDGRIQDSHSPQLRPEMEGVDRVVHSQGSIRAPDLYAIVDDVFRVQVGQEKVML